MTIRINEKQLTRCFFKGILAFLAVLLVGLFPYIYTLKHEFEAARAVKYESHVEILIGTHRQGKPSIKFSSLDEYLRKKISGDPIIRINRPNKDPNLVGVIAKLSNDQMRSIMMPFLEQEERRTDHVKQQIQDEIALRINMLDIAKYEVDKLLTRPTIENEVKSEAIIMIPWLQREILALEEELGKVEPTEADFIFQEQSGGRVWTIWRTIGAIIGSLGVIYFAIISGLAFGYILDHRQ